MDSRIYFARNATAILTGAFHPPRRRRIPWIHPQNPSRYLARDDTIGRASIQEKKWIPDGHLHFAAAKCTRAHENNVTHPHLLLRRRVMRIFTRRSRAKLRGIRTDSISQVFRNARASARRSSSFYLNAFVILGSRAIFPAP